MPIVSTINLHHANNFYYFCRHASDPRTQRLISYFNLHFHLTHQRLTAGIYHGLKGSTFSPVNASALCLAKK